METALKVLAGIVIIGGTIFIAVVSGGPVAIGAAFGAATGFVFGGGSKYLIGGTASNLLSKGITNNFARKIAANFATGLVDDVISSFASGGVKGVKENFAGIIGDNIFDSALGVFGNSNKFVSKTLYATDNIEVPKVKKALDAAKDAVSSINKLNKIDLDDVKNINKKVVEEADFIGKLRGENITLKDLSKDVEYLKEAGFTEKDILKMQNGRVPDGWQVHHKLPLDDSGTNNFDNLVLIKNEPYHKVITNYQNSFSKKLSVGEIKSIDWPIIDGDIYPKKH